MKKLFSIAPWINRVVLGAASVIFTMIGMRYLADPVGASANTGVTLTSALAATTTRIGFGAFPLAFALFSFLCLLSAEWLRAGVSLVATVVTTAIAVRLWSIITDGAVAQSTRLFLPEGAILLLALSGLLLEGAKRREQRRATA